MYNLVRFSIKSLRTTRTVLLVLSKKVRAKDTDEIVNLSRKIKRVADSLTCLEIDLIKLRKEEETK